MNLRKQLSSYIALNNYVEAVRENTSSVVLTDAIHNGLTGLQLKGKTELRLPIERYEVLEYLEVTNDSQYIKTKVVPDWTTEIDAKFRTGNDKTFTVLSRWTVSPTADTFGVIVSSTSSNIVSYFGRYSDGLYQNDVSFRLNANQDVVYKLSESSVQINEHNYSITRQNSGFENTLPLWIFKGNFLGEPNAVNPTGSRVYHLQIKTQGNLVFDGVPVRRRSDGILGIYDKVSGEFLINQGTGDFIAGNIIDTISVYLPEEYTMLDYIQSSGSQYIDTGRVPNNNDIIEQKFQKLGSTQTTCSWYGSMPSISTITPRIGIGTFTTNSILTFFAGSNYTTGLAPADTNVHTLKIQATSAQQITYDFDGTTHTVTTTSNTFEPAIELTSYLFARHGTNGVQVYDNEGTRIYYHREYLADGTLVLNMIPVRRNSDNVLGMYDIVSEQFFTNQGTDSFIAGPEMVPTPKPDKPVDIICNNGVLKVGPNNDVVVEGTPETVTITGKNVLNVNNLQILQNKAISDTGAYIDNPATNVCDTYIYVKPNTTYTMSGNTLSGSAGTGTPVYFRLAYYDSNKTFISRSEGIEGQYYTFTTDSNTNYIKFHYANSMSYLNTYMLEESSRPTKYEEYYQESFAPEDLLKLDNYEDVQNVINGIKSKKIGFKVLDGTEENWNVGTGTGFVSAYLSGATSSWGVDNTIRGICTHFNCKIAGETTNAGDYRFANDLNIYNLPVALNISTKEEFKAWLAQQYSAGTPVIIVYPLADTVEETVESRNVFITSGTNTIERNSEYVSSGDITVGYKKLR